MSKPISALRIASSILTGAGAQVLTAELDFDLGIDQGIEIFGVLGNVIEVSDSTLVAADDALNNVAGLQTLHLETGALSDPLDAGGDDAVRIDTEIFYRQDALAVVQNHATAQAGAGIVVTPAGLLTFPVPILTARNITHRLESLATDQNVIMAVLVYYRFVDLETNEQVFLLQRNR